MRVTVDADELAALRAEHRRLTQRVQELLESNTALVEAGRASLRSSVQHFMRLSEQPMLTKPGVPSDDLVRFRWKIHIEEVWEGLSACFAFYDKRTAEVTRGLMDRLIAQSSVRVDLVELADAIGDIDYISEGTRLTFGIDGGPVAAEIHRSNLAKVENGILRNGIGKIVKPPGWTPPDILGVLKEQGYQPPPEIDRGACSEIERGIDESAVAVLRTLRAHLEVAAYPGQDFGSLLLGAIQLVLDQSRPSWCTSQSGPATYSEVSVVEKRLLKWFSAIAPDGKHIVFATDASEASAMIDTLLERMARGGLEFVDPTQHEPPPIAEATS